jgi:peptidyl-tRNA hydrolase, PTH1 family
MKLIIGLGNPGSQYTDTRHNIGFTVLDSIVQAYDETWQAKSRFQAVVAEGVIDARPVLFVKPQTFYNDTGLSVRKIMDFYKIPVGDIIVIHDELAIPFGAIRTRLSGADAGNNGIKSISSHIGDHYARVRIGIYNELRDRQDDADFVLSRFNATEATHMPRIVEKTEHILADFVSDIFKPTSYQI